MRPRLNLEYLKTFITVVRCGGICKAATQMHLTQPAVTTRIRNLEESLSTTLFDRVNAGLTLTKRGEMMLNYANQFTHLIELVERDIIDPKGLKGYMRLGVSETIAQSWLPEFIRQFKQEYPCFEVQIDVDRSNSLREKLLGREIDLAFLLGPISECSIDNLELSPFNLAWYTSINNDSQKVDLLTRPITTYSKGTRPYRELKSLLDEKVGSDAQIYPSSSLSACFKLLENDLCIAPLPKIVADEYVRKGTIRTFDPGWVPNSLSFTASYLGDSKSYLVEKSADLALQVSIEHNAEYTSSLKPQFELLKTV